MDKSLFLLPFLILSLFSKNLHCQKKYIESDIDSYIDFTDNSAKLKFNEYSIQGKFTEVLGKDYMSYIIVDGGEDIWVISNLKQLGVLGFDILKGDYKTALKEFKKGRKYKKSQLLFSNLPSSDVKDGFMLINESERERYKKRNQSIVEFDSKIKESEFLGVYKIKILKHRNIDYKNVDTFGKIILTEVGITVETEIPSLNLLRGSFNKGNSDLDNGRFTCNIIKGYGDMFSLSLNKESKVGGLTTISGRNTNTTIFTIVE